MEREEYEPVRTVLLSALTVLIQELHRQEVPSARDWAKRQVDARLERLSHGAEVSSMDQIDVAHVPGIVARSLCEKGYLRRTGRYQLEKTWTQVCVVDSWHGNAIVAQFNRLDETLDGTRRAKDLRDELNARKERR